MPGSGTTAAAEAADFLPDTAGIRAAEWTVAAAAVDGAERLAGLDSYLDARRWAHARRRAAAGEPVAVIVVVDTLAAAFQLDEILHELRDFAVALELSPWGYLFSYVRTFSDLPECVLPDRADMTLATHCLRSYARHVVETAARRGAAVLNPPALTTGGLFGDDEPVVAADLLQVPRGRITERGARASIRLLLRHVAAVIDGGNTGPGDAAEAELARAQLWQWVHHDTGVLDTGRIVTAALAGEWLGQELAGLASERSDTDPSENACRAAARYLEAVTLAADLAPAIDVEAYRPAD